jgi:hypothetical protein
LGAGNDLNLTEDLHGDDTVYKSDKKGKEGSTKWHVAQMVNNLGSRMER